MRAKGEPHEVRYEGFFEENLFHGKGKLTFGANDPQGRQHYRGRFAEGQFQGHGTVVMRSGDSYKAKWEKGVAQGEGRSKSDSYADLHHI